LESLDGHVANSTEYQALEEKGFLFLEKLLPFSICDHLAKVSRQRKLKARKFGEFDTPDRGGFGEYGHPLFDHLLLTLLPTVESVVGTNVLPTYSYYRYYEHGDYLKKHTDRSACQFSLSLCLGSDGRYDWPLWFHLKDGLDVPLVTKTSCGVLYLGEQVSHSRLQFNGSWQSQVFLHYIRKDHPRANELVFDGRSELGIPR
tara:strand:- start:176897 stop:177502 length:606 start_codon:yes stop_codon:yes gene_type:complete